MTLTEKIQGLLLIDQRVRGLTSRLETAKNRREQKKTKLQQIEQQRTEMADQVRHRRAKATDLEKLAGDLADRIEHQRQTMNTVTNNKQYSALLTEVNTLKLEQSRLEDEALEQMGQVDLLKTEQEELTKRAAEQKKLVVVADQEVVTCQEEVGQDLEELTTQRNAAEQELPSQAQQSFRRLVKIHEDEALAEVIEASRRNMEYTCGGCYLSIPVERVNALMTSADEIVACPNCGRMLFIDQQLKSTLAK